MDFKLRPFNGARVPRPRQEARLVEMAKDHEALDLEIGCGAGMHAIRYANQNPRRFLVAIERTQEKFQAFESRLARHPSLPNLFALRDDAVSVVTHLLPARCLDRVFILYPNPYPKESQANKRWHRMPFVYKLHECMKKGAELTLATNEIGYRNEAVVWFVGMRLFELVTESTFALKDIGTPLLPVARTHFEKKYLNDGQSVYNLVFKRL